MTEMLGNGDEATVHYVAGMVTWLLKSGKCLQTCCIDLVICTPSAFELCV